MASTIIDGIETRYEVVGQSGPPLLMFSPGGFNATLDQWSSLGIYAKVKPLDHLSKHYRCIIFDRRETGRSGGRVERVGWSHYVAQGAGLLDHLGFDQAFLMGGCMGCCPVAAFAVAHPQRTLGMILYWPVGGAKYRISGHERFARHLAYVHERGLQGVVDLVKADPKPFGAEPRGGPWASVIANDPAFAERYAGQNVDAYKLVVSSMARTLIDRDTVPGAEPEELLRLDIPALVVPGRDASHATSAAWYLEECLPQAEIWNVPVEAQTSEDTGARLLSFLQTAGQSRQMEAAS
ncbi:alpha/beta hydrolase [Pusillimonas noertemannii]|uniref:Pimeloyl-ACP methyl ester carboxylesterase n=1 Tax=Pusillimonas noertemannii TaxID=305977 RepID=A0A2U1CIJ9_9BURK|nr:alpha/beta hydrolase [Pusillimonas noertemannii]NYT70358.1 alpha/beta hydrolase [Pusillimonas noertemannii]PVY60821.1 pimeloyl-ACP methyl ester carboxylesterase [Pusillimonas noertemannii]TFL08574.1 alpha/beta hydrolase [Pusillimonas noertemannii]